MKLRNKKTGEIKPAEAREDGIYLYDETTEQWYKYELDLLAEWWEYYEEPKVFYVVDLDGEILPSDFEDKTIEKAKELGNYFKAKEEAEKVVEELKAWKRLKDDDFKFIGWYYDVQPISNGRLNIQIRATLDESDNATLSDLELLFRGGE